ncbi:MAG: LLM class flavin-dependent oxidoreductase [Sandaracinaceae bacterium]|nr:LLM class flavin-dependent oxidoreductase [Sandaracinaceae bacterium]
MSQKIGLAAFWKQYDRKTYLKAAILADKLGYESFWVPEAWGYEQFSLLTEMAVHTKRIKLGTGITNVFSRSPALIAMQAATLDEISGGRVILGIGTSGKRVIEGLHGRPFEKPLTQVRDVIRAVRTLLAGGKLSEAGMKLHDYRPFALEIEPVREHIPIFVAAIKPNAIRSIGEMADGWMPIFYPYQEIVRGREYIAEGARKVGRDPDEIVTAPFTTLIPMPGRKAAEKARELIAFYVGGMGDYYYELLAGFGYKEECDEIARLYRDKSTRAQAEAAVTDEMIDALTISGNPLHCRRELRRREQYGFQHPVLGLPSGAPWPLIAAFIAMNAPTRFP